jgi:hypothetical protein
LNVATWNCQGLPTNQQQQKLVEINMSAVCAKHELDLLVLTETHSNTPEDNVIIPGFDSLCSYHPSQARAGIQILFRTGTVTATSMEIQAEMGGWICPAVCVKDSYRFILVGFYSPQASNVLSEDVYAAVNTLCNRWTSDFPDTGIIWLGDFNADLSDWSTLVGRDDPSGDHYAAQPRMTASSSGHPTSRNDRLTAEVCFNHELVLADGYQTLAKFTRHQGMSAGSIDHIITDRCTREAMMRCQVLESSEATHCSGMSDHRMLGISIELQGEVVGLETEGDQVVINKSTPFLDICNALRAQAPINVKSRITEWTPAQWDTFRVAMEVAAGHYRSQWAMTVPDMPDVQEASITFIANILAAAASIQSPSASTTMPPCTCSPFVDRKARAIDRYQRTIELRVKGASKGAAAQSVTETTTALARQTMRCRSASFNAMLKPLMGKIMYSQPRQFYNNIKAFDRHGQKKLRTLTPQFFDMHDVRVPAHFVLDATVEWFCSKLSLHMIPNVYTAGPCSWPIPPLEAEHHGANSAPIHVQEVINAAKAMDSTKSPGISGDSPALYKHLGASATAWLTSIFNRIWANAEIPGTLLCGQLMPIPKPNKDVKKVQNRRPITIMPTMMRLYDTIICHRLQLVLTETAKLSVPPKEWPRPWMYGFRKSSSALLEILTIIEYSRMGSSADTPVPIAAVCVDVAGAYDGMQRDQVAQDLKEAGISSHLFASVMAFMWGYRFRIHHGGRISCILCPSMGHVQGGPSVPIIWLIHCIWRETILQSQLVPSVPNILINHLAIKLSQSAYADDHIKLILAIAEYLADAMTLVTDGMEASGDKPADDKNFGIALDRNASGGNLQLLKHNTAALRVGHTPEVPVVDDCILRGVSIAAGGSLQPHAISRYRTAEDTRRTWYSARRFALPFTTVLALCKVAWLPKLLYGTAITHDLNYKLMQMAVGNMAADLLGVSMRPKKPDPHNKDKRQATVCPWNIHNVCLMLEANMIPADILVVTERLRLYGWLLSNKERTPSNTKVVMLPLMTAATQEALGNVEGLAYSSKHTWTASCTRDLHSLLPTSNFWDPSVAPNHAKYTREIKGAMTTLHEAWTFQEIHRHGLQWWAEVFGTGSRDWIHAAYSNRALCHAQQETTKSDRGSKAFVNLRIGGGYPYCHTQWRSGEPPPTCQLCGATGEINEHHLIWECNPELDGSANTWLGSRREALSVEMSKQLLQVDDTMHSPNMWLQGQEQRNIAAWCLGAEALWHSAPWAVQVAPRESFMRTVALTMDILDKVLPAYNAVVDEG